MFEAGFIAHGTQASATVLLQSAVSQVFSSLELQNKRERVVIGSADRLVQLNFCVVQRTPTQNPIDSPSTTQARSWRGRTNIPVVEVVVERFSANNQRGHLSGQIEIEVARYDDGHIRTILVRIIENLCELTAAQVIVAAAFQVNVIHDQPIAKTRDVAY